MIITNPLTKKQTELHTLTNEDQNQKLQSYDPTEPQINSN